jgi:hypothetical protein
MVNKCGTKENDRWKLLVCCTTHHVIVAWRNGVLSSYCQQGRIFKSESRAFGLACTEIAVCDLGRAVLSVDAF